MTSLWLDGRDELPRGVPLTAGLRYDVLVAGAGLTGLTTAVLLCRAGYRVGILEARTVGAVATGNTTAKISLLQGRTLSGIRRQHGGDAVAAYLAANLAGQAWLLDFLAARDVPYQVRTAISYSAGPGGLRVLEDELAAATAAGLPAAWCDDPGLPFAVEGGIQLPGQAQFDPVAGLAALLDEFLLLGGALHTGVRLRSVAAGDPCRADTSAGDVSADRVVLATGAPVLDRGAHFARLRPQRSYALAFRVPGAIPSGMYLAVDSPTRSLRTVPVPDDELLLVGGNGHPVGRTESPRRQVDDLHRWASRHFPGAALTHSWSAQDYEPASGLPLVGTLPGSRERVHLATGYNKWGMTNGVAAGLRLAGEITGEPPEWADALDEVRPTTAGLARGLRFSAEVVAEIGTGYWRGLRNLPESAPGEGEGVIGRLGIRPAARSTVGDSTRTVSAICTHLGGILTWNDAECSWDCPLHGSRFDPEGRVLEGPATTDLARLDQQSARPHGQD